MPIRSSPDFTGITYDSGSTTSATRDFTGLNAGDYTVYARIIDKDEDFTQYSANVTIKKAEATVTVAGYTGAYDAAAHGATGTVVGVAGDFSAAGSSLSLGVSFSLVPGGTANWTFTGGTNYKDQSGSVAIVINSLYVSNGFLQPISLNRAFKQGSTVPIKWQVNDAGGNAVTSLAAITNLTVTGPSGATTALSRQQQFQWCLGSCGTMAASTSTTGRRRALPRKLHDTAAVRGRHQRHAKRSC